MSETKELAKKKKIKIKKTKKTNIEILNMEGLEYLKSVKDNTIDLILTDPPYIISHSTGMDKHYNQVLENYKNDVKFVKTEAEWLVYKKKRKLKDDSKKNIYMKYGTIYGKKYSVRTNYGDWMKNLLWIC